MTIEVLCPVGLPRRTTSVITLSPSDSSSSTDLRRGTLTTLLLFGRRKKLLNQVLNNFVVRMNCGGFLPHFERKCLELPIGICRPSKCSNKVVIILPSRKYSSLLLLSRQCFMTSTTDSTRAYTRNLFFFYDFKERFHSCSSRLCDKQENPSFLLPYRNDVDPS
jgi:hypothetical protein